MTRAADPTGAAPSAAGALAGAATTVDRLPFVVGSTVGAQELPLVVIDLLRAARRFRALREAFPWVDVRYDVSALAHPALLETMAAEGAGFTVTHPAALPALGRAHVDPRRVLHASPGVRSTERRAAWEAGVRTFVVDDALQLDAFVAAPAGTTVLLRIDPDSAMPVVQRAETLGVPVGGLSLRIPPDAPAAGLATELQRAVRANARIAAETGSHCELLDLGSAFLGAAAARPATWPALARTIRSLVAPATSRTTVLATAGSELVSDCISVVTGGAERYADPESASALIDAGAEVLVLRESAADRRLPRLPLFRAPTGRDPLPRPAETARHRVLSPARARSTWSPAD